MKKIVRLTEGELTNLIKRILKEDSTKNNCHKEYTNPESNTDPYIYRMGPECIWQTKSDKTKKQIGKEIPDWISLYKNEKANQKLDKWFPNAKSDCSKCKNGGIKKTPPSDLIKKKVDLVKGKIGENKCPKTINCMPSPNGKPNPCDDFFISYCIKSGKTSATY
jgi:hypothetical protein